MLLPPTRLEVKPRFLVRALALDIYQKRQRRRLQHLGECQSLTYKQLNNLHSSWLWVNGSSQLLLLVFLFFTSSRER
jgi:hypothetical protein